MIIIHLAAMAVHDSVHWKFAEMECLILESNAMTATQYPEMDAQLIAQ
jgi:hypothetical protein